MKAESLTHRSRMHLEENGSIRWMGDLINWVELSRYLAGNESSVSRTRCPKKYQDKVNALISLIEDWGNIE